jgi:hypothetical protein
MIVPGSLIFMVYSEVDMQFEALLEKKRKSILKKWYSLIMESYPPDSSSFFMSEKDRFANPVGYAILTGIATIFDGITCKKHSNRIISALDSIIRIRAVQDFTPSQAIGFVSLLKTAIRDAMMPGIEHEMYLEIQQIEAKIDNLASVASEIYDRCREDINRLKIRKAYPRRFIEDRLMSVTNSKKK